MRVLANFPIADTRLQGFGMKRLDCGIDSPPELQRQRNQVLTQPYCGHLGFGDGSHLVIVGIHISVSGMRSAIHQGRSMAE